jgi:hypothetical protein
VKGLYGYTVRSQNLGELPALKDGFVIKRTKVLKPLRRTVVQSSLGCFLARIGLPHPSPDDPDTIASGFMKRFASRPPASDPALLRELKEFVRKFIERNLVPLRPDTGLGVEEWLANTSYPEWRKKELLDLLEKFPTLDRKKHTVVKSFMKDETYVEFKHARGINARHDRFKVEVGPTFKKIEDAVYRLKYFIKHTPVADRPKKISELLRAGRKIYATDYTAFEALFTAQIMEAVEFQLYSYMTQYLPNHDSFMDLMYGVLAGENILENKFWSMRLPATRMSGEMCTSLGNGFSNLMFMLFVAFKSGVDVDGFVEGDDGIFVNMRGGDLDSSLFTQLGLKIKLEEHEDICSASFCGIIFDPTDNIPIADPRKILATFGWCSNRYHGSKPGIKRDLLRMKSLALKFQYPGCPIVSALADYGLRMTRGRDVDHFVRSKVRVSEWERARLIEALKTDPLSFVPVGMASRLLVEKKFGLAIETQLKIEKYLDSKNDVSPLELDFLDVMVHSSWSEYFSKYSTRSDRQDLAEDFQTLAHFTQA